MTNINTIEHKKVRVYGVDTFADHILLELRTVHPKLARRINPYQFKALVRRTLAEDAICGGLDFMLADIRANKKEWLTRGAASHRFNHGNPSFAVSASEFSRLTRRTGFRFY